MEQIRVNDLVAGRLSREDNEELVLGVVVDRRPLVCGSCGGELAWTLEIEVREPPLLKGKRKKVNEERSLRIAERCPNVTEHALGQALLSLIERNLLIPKAESVPAEI